ncbi:HAD family hydrolase [Cohnella zeiphila]|uniref:HAD family hydrolase n=1 Tax=Cohnella zeiphila TaxID=2761120 RepID=A0A7X0SI56_9BACL|nr:HAD hydrolase-like protein [Cohnella zeiphila]MBB6730316.1 HAD family hydrolase [Cohnella zeiphila]
MKQNILFDLDDTLIYCNKYFNLVQDQFVDLMTDWFAPFGIGRGAIMDKHSELDIAGVQSFGFKSDHFPQSFVDTYDYFSRLTGRAASQDERLRLWRLGNSVYDHEVEPYPFMEETLLTLAAEGHRLHLYTGGDAIIQRRKIERMNLERFFEDRIYVRMHKNTDAMKDILKQGRFDEDRTWMIGNSLRTDVLPALECGIRAIYLKRDQEWAYNLLNIETPSSSAMLTLTELNEVPPAIQQHIALLKPPGL